jgi:hypothetical protein
MPGKSCVPVPDDHFVSDYESLAYPSCCDSSDTVTMTTGSHWAGQGETQGAAHLQGSMYVILTAAMIYCYVNYSSIPCPSSPANSKITCNWVCTDSTVWASFKCRTVTLASHA